MKRLRDFAKRYNLMMDMRTIIVTVLVMALFTSTLFGILNINRPLMVILSGVFLLAGIISYRGYFVIGSWVAVITAIIGLSYLFYVNNGIRDTALLGLIVVLVAAGLLAGKAGTLVVGVLLILEVGVFAALETQGVIINKFSAESYFADYLTICIFIALITTLQWLVISQLNKTIQNAEQELNERLQTEVKLREAEARYRNLVERIPLVIYISEPGQGGAWKYVSPQITSLTGYTPEEWIQDPQLWFSRIHPDDRDRILEAETNAIKAGKMPRLEYRLMTRDGNYIWVYDESLLILDNIQHGLVQGFLLDITTRKQAEEQLRLRMAELKAVYGLSETLSQKTDLQKLIHATGEQIRLTFKASNVLISIHDPVTDLIHFPYDYEDGNPRKNQPIRFGEGMTTKIMLMRKPLIILENWMEEASKLNVILTNSIPVRSTISVPIITPEHVIGVISLESSEREFAFSENDVHLLATIAANLAVAIENTRLQTSLKQELEIQDTLIRELEMKNEELERFTYTASHDLKSPLITIRGFLGYLEKDARTGNLDRLGLDIQRISDATDKMHRLLSELLELSRVGRVTNERKIVPFLSIVTESLRRVEGQLKERQVSVKVRGDLPSVCVDEERIVEVMQNLIDNAIKFMGEQENPGIEINYQLEDNQPVFFVRDNGIGIKKEFHERVFGLFDKLDVDSPGTGVGLALVKRIVEVHGGKVWIESDGATGSTFLFTLPDKQ